MIILILSLLYWQLVSLWGDVDEPWDATAYWTIAYPLSILFAGSAGWISRRHGWAVGMMISLSQWPVMATQEGGETHWAIGLIFLLPLSMPHGAAAFIGGRLKRRRR